MGSSKRAARGGRSSNPNIKSLVGNIYGRLTVVADDGSRTGSGSVKWLCQCSCGNTTHRTGGELKRNPNSSCGCWVSDRMRHHSPSITHGMSKTSVYVNWHAMKRRCTDPKHKNYKEYGARGITICEEWLDFEAFYSDMGEPATGQTLDRKDNDKGYSKDNCRWVSHRVQMNNTRRNRLLTLNGESKSMADWARDPRVIALGLDYYTLRGRKTICKWGDEKALTTPHKDRSNLHEQNSKNRNDTDP